MDPTVSTRLQPLLELAGLLELAAQKSARALRKVAKERTRPHQGTTLRPGPSTPLWNELARIATEQLTKRGDKANLARVLGVPRQRVHEYLVSRTVCPDTERALRLAAWLLAQGSGRNFS